MKHRNSAPAQDKTEKYANILLRQNNSNQHSQCLKSPRPSIGLYFFLILFFSTSIYKLFRLFQFPNDYFSKYVNFLMIRRDVVYLDG